MLIDEATITVSGGSGGDGKVAFFAGRGKPAGGDGGRGGDVYALIDPHLTSLVRYVRKRTYKAVDGADGGTTTKDGKDGDHLTLTFPPGTQLTDIQSGEVYEPLMDTPTLLTSGGRGGWGNSTISRRRPGVFSLANQGVPGKVREFHVVLRLIADCGLIGLPNAGKSSLLNALTRAHAQVADYPFTTLEPNLGILKLPISNLQFSKAKENIILADIPGLIEGASTGKGLGDKFLKHIEKVRVLLHCISVETHDLTTDYQTIRRELSAYNPSLLDKKEIIILTKSDTVCDDATREKLMRAARSLASTVVYTSVIDDISLTRLADTIGSLV